ncbi:MAG: hypothetical protein QF554_06915 [Dehalococcoidia bacterium]|nr:hypothetical protein [Dehalococcoidia bacterium]
MLAIIQNPRLLAAFLALFAIVVVVIVIVILVSGGDSVRKVAFVSETDDEFTVYLLSDTSDTEEDPEPLLDGLTGIADILRSPGGDETLVLADKGDGLTITRLSDDPEASPDTIDIEGAPTGIAWAPGGDGFAFSGKDDDGLYFIQLSRDGKDLSSLLANSTSVPTLGGWSSSLDWFAYALSGDSESRGVYIKNPDGVNILQLTGAMDSYPRWSPDGEQIAYLSRDDDGTVELFVINRDGSAPVEIAEISNGLPDFDWSPDSDRLVFTNGQRFTRLTRTAKSWSN